MQKITPFLWFDNNAEEAINFYASIFPNTRLKDSSAGPDGGFFTGTFELNGQEFMALNGGPEFKFTEAFSLFVRCDTQDEVDNYWSKLTADGGEESQCGWLKDRYGLSWQIVPAQLDEWMKDPARADRMMAELLKMKKLDIETLKNA